MKGAVLFLIAILIICILCAATVSGAQEEYYSITQEEREMLARLVFLEVGTCGSQCQRAVVSVIFNLREAGYWGDTLEEVVYHPNTFSPAYLIASCDQPPQEVYDAVDYVIANGPTIPKEVRYFRADEHFTWEGYQGYAVYDNVYFGYFTNGNH